jgi:hypothetical protein
VKVLAEGDETHVERYAPGADTEEKAAVYQVRAGATTTVPTVRLERGGTISGRVLDARGKPLAGVGVQIAGKAWWDEAYWTTTTDSAGRYRLTNVTTGPHKLKVTPPSYTGLGSVWVGGAGDARRARAVTVPYGRTVSLPDQRLKAGARLAVVLGAVDESVVVEALDPQGRIVVRHPWRCRSARAPPVARSRSPACRRPPSGCTPSRPGSTRTARPGWAAPGSRRPPRWRSRPGGRSRSPCGRPPRRSRGRG